MNDNARCTAPRAADVWMMEEPPLSPQIKRGIFDFFPKTKSGNNVYD
jgi:hypothetical protein